MPPPQKKYNHVLLNTNSVLDYELAVFNIKILRLNITAYTIFSGYHNELGNLDDVLFLHNMSKMLQIK